MMCNIIGIQQRKTVKRKLQLCLLLSNKSNNKYIHFIEKNNCVKIKYTLVALDKS